MPSQKKKWLRWQILLCFYQNKKVTNTKKKKKFHFDLFVVILNIFLYGGSVVFLLGIIYANLSQSTGAIYQVS